MSSRRSISAHRGARGHAHRQGSGDGIPANQAARLIGRVAAVDVPDTLLPTDALDWELKDKQSVTASLERVKCACCASTSTAC
jgi:hypothetical protein